MHTKSLCTLGLLILAAGTLPGQTYWSTSPSLDCGGSNAGGAIVQGPLQITAPTGGTGYVCYVSGTFLWYAAGAGWHTAIRVAAPESGAIRADYSFVGIAGNPLSLDLATNGGTTETQSGSEAVFTLNANQPLEVDLLGRTGAGPGYSNQTGGSVYAIFECPDATTCSYVTPQLLGWNRTSGRRWVSMTPRTSCPLRSTTPTRAPGPTRSRSTTATETSSGRARARLLR